MVYKGQVKNGVVVLEGNPPLPEGAEVQVQLVADETAPTSTAEWLLSFAGSVDDLPPDASRNLGRYLYGAPKR